MYVFVLIDNIVIFAVLFEGKKHFIINNYSMYAIVDIAGKQFKVTQDQFVYAPLMEGEDGASVEIRQSIVIR